MRNYVLPLVVVQYDLFCIVREKHKMCKRMDESADVHLEHSVAIKCIAI